MGKEEILILIVFSVIGIAALTVLLIRSFVFIKNFLKKLIILKSNKLTFYRQYEYSRGYDTVPRRSIESLNTIIKKFHKLDNEYGVSIKSYFNKRHYAVFDLDTIEQYDLFKKLYKDEPYVIFESSIDHFWGILDKPYKKINDILKDYNWKTCNDNNYVKYSVERKEFHLRGIYENELRIPKLAETNGDLSKNFKLFINKLVKFYSNEALELSILRYKDDALLLKYNRKTKLEKLKNAG
jgi:hypothetical protein